MRRLRRICITCADERPVADNGQNYRLLRDGVVRTNCHACHQKLHPPRPTTHRTLAVPRDDIDEVMVDRLMGGRSRGANIAERLEATARLVGLYRLPATLAAERMGVTPRTVERYKRELRATGRLAA